MERHRLCYRVALNVYHWCCITSCEGSERICGVAFVISSCKLSVFWAPAGMVIYYDYMVPAEERHDSAIKRNRENLSAEVKLWEGYLEQVRWMAMKNSTFAQTKEQ